MTVPGVNVIVAATFMAAVGDIGRFPVAAQAGRLPRPRPARPPVRAPARRPTATSPKQGSAPGRVTRSSRRAGARSASRARCARSTSASAPAAATRSRSSPRAQARLPVLVPAHPRRGLRLRPALADQEEAAPARAHRRRPRHKGSPASGPTNEAMRQAERELAHQAERAYERTVADWQQKQRGASATPGRASQKGPRRAKPRGRPQAPDVCALARRRPRPHQHSHRSPARSSRLDFHPSAARAPFLAVATAY